MFKLSFTSYLNSYTSLGKNPDMLHSYKITYLANTLFSLRDILSAKIIIM
jgi:hypothetical protein